jgi:hypothetical protein
VREAEMREGGLPGIGRAPLSCDNYGSRQRCHAPREGFAFLDRQYRNAITDVTGGPQTARGDGGSTTKEPGHHGANAQADQRIAIQQEDDDHRSNRDGDPDHLLGTTRRGRLAEQEGKSIHDAKLSPFAALRQALSATEIPPRKATTCNG